MTLGRCRDGRLLVCNLLLVTAFLLSPPFYLNSYFQIKSIIHFTNRPNSRLRLVLVLTILPVSISFTSAQQHTQPPAPVVVPRVLVLCIDSMVGPPGIPILLHHPLTSLPHSFATSFLSFVTVSPPFPASDEIHRRR